MKVLCTSTDRIEQPRMAADGRMQPLACGARTPCPRAAWVMGLLLVVLPVGARAVVDVGLVQTVSPSTVSPGDPLVISLTVTNVGDETATGISVFNSTPPYTAIQSIAVDTGTYIEMFTVWSVGELAPGAAGTMTVSLLAVTPDEWGGTIENPFKAQGDGFGAAIARLESGRYAVGAPDAEPAGTNLAGRAYLFEADGSYVTEFVPPALADWQQFGAAVSAYGERVAVGAPGALVATVDVGSVFLYADDGAPLSTIANPDPDSTDGFGDVLCEVGNGRLLVGDPSSWDPGPFAAGVVYLYRTNATLLATLTSPTPVSNGRFGTALCPLGTGHFIVGDPGGNAVHRYTVDGVWSSSITNSAFGFGSAVGGPGGNRIVVGAPYAGPVRPTSTTARELHWPPSWIRSGFTATSSAAASPPMHPAALPSPPGSGSEAAASSSTTRTEHPRGHC